MTSRNFAFKKMGSTHTLKMFHEENKPTKTTLVSFITRKTFNSRKQQQNYA
jgi:hypothetical protein